MDLKWKPGSVELDSGGLPATVEGLEELLQNAAMALTLPRGSFLYGMELGSGLAELDPASENSGQRAVALANEALLALPGVRAREVTYSEETGTWTFSLETPEGPGQVSVPGKEETDGQL